MKTSRDSARNTLSALSLFVLGGVALSIGSLVAAAQPPAQPGLKQQHIKKSVTANSAVRDAGERKFQENCSRCHTAPEQLSPRVTGTVMLHMRIRASLSAEDEREILHYLSP